MTGLFVIEFFNIVVAQSTADVFKDSISYYLQRDDLASYFIQVSNRTRVLTESATKDSIITASELEEVLASSDLLLKYYRNLNAEERLSLRIACMRTGNRIGKHLSRFVEGLQYYKRAHEMVADEECLDTLAWFIENPLCNYYTRLGDYEQAIAMGTKVERSLIFYEKDHLLPRFYSNLGDAYYWSRQLDEASIYYEKGLALAEADQNTQAIVANLVKLAILKTDQGELEAAKFLAARSDFLLQKLKGDKGYLERKAAVASVEGAIHDQKGEYEEAISHYKRALSFLREFYKTDQRRELAKIYIRLGSLYQKLDSFEMAEVNLRLGLSSILPGNHGSISAIDPSLVYLENSFIELFKVQADLYATQALHQPSDTTMRRKVIQSVNLALKANDLLRQNLAADPSKLLSIEDNKKLIDIGIQTVYQLYQHSKNASYVHEARSFFSRSKSLLLDEKVRTSIRTAELTSADRDALYQLDFAIMECIEKQFESVDIDHSLQSTRLKLEEQRKLILDRYKTQIKKVPTTMDYIEYNVQAHDVYALASLHNELTLVRLGERKKLVEFLNELNGYIRAKGMSGDEDVLLHLFDFLVRPVTASWPEKLTIIPDGEIGLLPFEMLKSDALSFGLQHSIISYSYTFEQYSYGSPLHRDPYIVCLAPVYPASITYQAEPQRGSIYSLPFVKEEIQSIKDIFGRSVEILNAHRKADYLMQLQEVDIFHYAGHAIVEKDRAYLALGGEGGQEELTEEEIGVFHFPLRLVVLSACETGLGKLEYGEGIRSLGKSFIEAGAAATVYSLWTVNDRSTAVIMKYFYTYLKKGYRKDKALQLAKLDFLKKAPQAYKHPYFWAAFVAVGDMQPMSDRLTAFIWWMGGICVLGLFIFWLKKRVSSVKGEIETGK